MKIYSTFKQMFSLLLGAFQFYSKCALSYTQRTAPTLIRPAKSLL